MKVSLLQFFRDGHFHGIKLGFHRNEIEEILGKPDIAKPGHSHSQDYDKAGLWYYAGVQFTFCDLDANVVDNIGFKPPYVLPTRKWYRDLETEKTELDLWVFDSQDEPTIQDLKNALVAENIDFQDTGLESIIFNEAIKNFQVIPYDSDAEESFGTLVLKSGIQVRYSDDGSILRVQIGGNWSFKGKEQDIAC